MGFLWKIGLCFNQKIYFGQISQSPKKSERKKSASLPVFSWKSQLLQHTKTKYFCITKTKCISHNENKTTWHFLIIPLLFSLFNEWFVRKWRINFLIDNKNKSGRVEFPVKRKSVFQPDLLSKEIRTKIMSLKSLFSDVYITLEKWTEETLHHLWTSHLL